MRLTAIENVGRLSVMNSSVKICPRAENIEYINNRRLIVGVWYI